MIILVDMVVSCGWGVRVGWVHVLPKSCCVKQCRAELSESSFGGKHPALPVEKCCFTGPEHTMEVHLLAKLLEQDGVSGESRSGSPAIMSIPHLNKVKELQLRRDICLRCGGPK